MIDIGARVSLLIIELAL